MLLFLTSSSLGRYEGFPYACSWATHNWFAFSRADAPQPVFTLEARNMIEKQKPGRRNYSVPNPWIDFGITTFLSQYLNDSDLMYKKRPLGGSSESQRKPQTVAMTIFARSVRDGPYEITESTFEG